MGALAWLRRNLVLVLGLLVLLYTFVPIFIVVLMSFNDPDSRLIYRFDGFTFHNWLNPCEDASMCSALARSIEIGLLATLVATILGTLAAFALVRHDFAGRSATNLLVFLPMAAPEIVLGASLLALFVAGGFAGQLGFWTILVAHIMFCLSFVVVTVRARLAGMDDNLEQAAMDLYATPAQTFWKVTFPLVFPGILGAALLAFSLSFDDFIITNLNAGHDDDVPDVRLGRREGRRTDAGQRGRHPDVRDRDRDRARGRGAQSAPRRGMTSTHPALADAERSVFWLDDPTRPEPMRRRSSATRPPTWSSSAVATPGCGPPCWPGCDGPDARSLLVEAGACGDQASGRNGGFAAASLTHGFGNGLDRWPDELDVLDRLGRENLHEHRARPSPGYGIDCDWEAHRRARRSRRRAHQVADGREVAALMRDHGHSVAVARRRTRCERRSTPRRTWARCSNPRRHGAGRARPARLGSAPRLPRRGRRRPRATRR